MSLRRSKLRLVLLALIVLGLVAGTLLYDRLVYGPRVAAGYVAQQLCSLRYVTGLPDEPVFVERIRRAAGPLRDQLEVEVLPEGGVRVRALWGDATAIARPELGCTLLVERDAASVRKTRVQVARPVLPEGAPWPEGSSGLHADRSGVDLLALEAAIAAAFEEVPNQANVPRATLGVLVAHEGRLVAERYAHGVGPKTPLLGWSAAKSLVTLLVGRLALERGFDVHAQLDKIVPHASGEPPLSADHLLRMTSGLGYEESYAPGGDAALMLFSSASMAGFMAARSRAHAPGERFVYATGSSVLLLRELQERLGGDLTRSYPAIYALAFAPLGISSGVIEPDESGGLVGGAYAHLTGQDWLRIGQLLLQDGVWQGKRLLPEGFVKYATTPTNVKPSYGASLWLNTGAVARDRLYPSLPEELFLLRGRDGQFVAVLPSARLVVARFGLTGVESLDNSFEALVRGVLAAISRR